MPTAETQQSTDAIDAQAIDQPEASTEVNRRTFLKNLIGLITASALDTLMPQDAEAAKEKDLINELFKAPKIRPPEGHYNKSEQEKWRKRYNGTDTAYNQAVLRYRIRKGWAPTTPHQELIIGWEKLKKSGFLNNIFDTCKKYGAPFDLVFLALAESHWKTQAKSRVGAAGPWQFMKPTAIGMGLTVNNKQDDRCDQALSTDAAIRLLCENYLATYRWEHKPQPNGPMNNHDRWAYAMWAYNGSAGRLVKPRFKSLGGAAAPYARVTSRINRENATYVNKIFGVRLALADYEKKNVGPAKAMQEAPAPKVTKKSPADVLYENYGAAEKSFSASEKLQALEKIKNMYLKERGIHPENYIDAAVTVISEEMREIRQDNPEAFAKQRSEGDTTVTVETDADGEPVAHVKSGESREGDAVDYEVLPGDSMEKIARRLSGEWSRWKLVQGVIADMNPEIEDINIIQVGQNLRVPGQYIEVPRVKLSQLLAKYYPGVPANDAEAFLKFLNGRRRDKPILVGETILVPLIR